MCLTATNTMETVEVQVDGERIKVDRKMIMKESKFFTKALTSPKYDENSTIKILDTNLEDFQNFLKICEGNESIIDLTNVSVLLTLAQSLDAQSIVNKCMDFLLNMTNDEEAYFTFNLLETIVERKEKKKPVLTKQLFDRIYCPIFLSENRNYMQTISSEAKTFLLESLIVKIVDSSAEKTKESAKMKKLEQKTSILESQLRKALDEIRASKDQQKSNKDAQSELGKMKKQLAISEKKTKSLEEELEKLRKKLSSENKQNKEFKKKLNETIVMVRKSEECFEESIQMEKKMFEDRLEEMKQSIMLESEAVRRSLETEKGIIQDELNVLKETVARLQNELQSTQKPLQTDVATSTIDLKITTSTSTIETQTCLVQSIDCNTMEYKLSPLTESAFYLEDPTNAFIASGYPWKKRPVWNKAVFL